jgi:transcriptional regulator with PAS, ATPase and Fis domain
MVGGGTIFLDEKEKKLIRHMLALKYGKSCIASELNVSHATLFRRMKKYGLTGRQAAG